MSSLLKLFGVLGSGGVAGGSVVVTGPITVSHFDTGVTTHAGITFAADGGLDQLGPGLATRTADTAGEWWSDEPEASIGSSYDVRCASISVGSWTAAAAGTGTWIDMSAERIWRVTATGAASPITVTCTASFEIRPTGGGSTLATFTVTCEASN